MWWILWYASHSLLQGHGPHLPVVRSVGCWPFTAEFFCYQIELGGSAACHHPWGYSKGRGMVKKENGLLFKRCTYGKMAGFFLEPILSRTPKGRTLPASAKPVQGCPWSSFSHSKILSFENHEWLQHDHPGCLACSWLQSGFRLLTAVCTHGPRCLATTATSSNGGLGPLPTTMAGHVLKGFIVLALGPSTCCWVTWLSGPACLCNGFQRKSVSFCFPSI